MLVFSTFQLSNFEKIINVTGASIQFRVMINIFIWRFSTFYVIVNYKRFFHFSRLIWCFSAVICTFYCDALWDCLHFLLWALCVCIYDIDTAFLIFFIDLYTFCCSMWSISQFSRSLYIVWSMWLSMTPPVVTAHIITFLLTK